MPAVTGLVPLMAWNWKCYVSVAAVFGEDKADVFTYPDRNIVDKDEERTADAEVEKCWCGDCSLRRDADWDGGDLSKTELDDHEDN